MSGRVGLVDVGSNAVRMRIVEAGGGETRVLHDRRAAVRVGRDVFVSGEIAADSLAAVGEVLAGFRRECDRLAVGAVRAVATAAARAARNGPALCAAAQEAGVDLEIIDGEREAALLHAAVRRRLPLPGRCVLVDLGAGSLEIVVVHGDTPASMQSHPLGSLLLRDGLAEDARSALGPPLLAAIDALLDARAGAAAAQLADAAAERLVGIGSSIDVVADLEATAGRGRKVGGVPAVTAAALTHWRTELAAVGEAERQRRFGLTADRADLVVVALSVYAWLLQRLDLDVVLAPGVSLRDGLLAEWLAASD